VVLRASLEVAVKRKIPAPPGDQTPVVQLVDVKNKYPSLSSVLSQIESNIIMTIQNVEFISYFMSITNQLHKI
jgi:hypothetical protein